jgi:hypothetical protein
MAKEDIQDIPKSVPHKRGAIEGVPDMWLAIWAGDESLPPSQRKRAQEERDRRKALIPDKKLGLLVGQEGVTPQQLDKLKELLGTSGATEVHHPGVASKVHTACRALGVPVTPHRDVRVDDAERMKLVVKASDRIIAAPPVGSQPGVWDGIRYAKHRSLPVIVVQPDGSVAD